MKNTINQKGKNEASKLNLDGRKKGDGGQDGEPRASLRDDPGIERNRLQCD